MRDLCPVPRSFGGSCAKLSGFVVMVEEPGEVWGESLGLCVQGQRGAGSKPKATSMDRFKG